MRKRSKPIWRSPRGNFRHFFQDDKYNYGYVLDYGKDIFGAFGPVSTHNFQTLKEAKDYIEKTYKRD